jgi:hypothetical protein
MTKDTYRVLLTIAPPFSNLWIVVPLLKFSDIVPPLTTPSISLRYTLCRKHIPHQFSKYSTMSCTSIFTTRGHFTTPSKIDSKGTLATVCIRRDMT